MLPILLVLCQLSVTSSQPTINKDIVITSIKDNDWVARVKNTRAENPEKVISYVQVGSVDEPIYLYVKRSEIKKDTLETALRFIQDELYWTYAVFNQRMGYKDVEIVVRSDGRWSRREASGWAPINPMGPLMDKRMLPPSWGGSYTGKMPTGQGNSLNSWRERKNYGEDTYFWFTRKERTNRGAEEKATGKAGAGEGNKAGELNKAKG
jgi:hypothetical protein